MSAELHEHYPGHYLIQPTNCGDLIVSNPRRGRRYDKHDWRFRNKEDEVRWERNGRPPIENQGKVSPLLISSG